jgi:hypothetical protein
MCGPLLTAEQGENFAFNVQGAFHMKSGSCHCCQVYAAPEVRGDAVTLARV